MTITYKHNDDGSIVSYRQGDCLLVAIESMDAADRKRMKLVETRGRARIVLLEGEATGHAHAILDVAGVELRTSDTDLAIQFLTVLSEGGVDLVHDEHTAIHLPEGDYEQRRQTETFERESRYVAD